MGIQQHLKLHTEGRERSERPAPVLGHKSRNVPYVLSTEKAHDPRYRPFIGQFRASWLQPSQIEHRRASGQVWALWPGLLQTEQRAMFGQFRTS
jgi:hypothetical protein